MPKTFTPEYTGLITFETESGAVLTRFAPIYGQPLTNAVGTTIVMPKAYQPLSPCCDAFPKGSTDSMTGIVCRNCYADLESAFGAPVDAITFLHEHPEVTLQTHPL